MSFTKEHLERQYAVYNKRAFVHPDPLEFLYSCGDASDREIVALVASSLAYGRVQHILNSVKTALESMGTPLAFVTDTSKERKKRAFKGFRHRFTSGDQLANLLHSAGGVMENYGSLETCFAAGLDSRDANLLPAMSRFSRTLVTWRQPRGSFNLLPDPLKGSACKRMCLMLRWLVRRDNVDPGGWDAVSPSCLIVPLDTHMYRIGIEHGLTEKKSPNMKAALEITEAFAHFCPEDPVRYDFALTRPGIAVVG